MKLTSSVLLAMVVTAFTGFNAHATVYSLAGDWSTSANPSTNWAYGYYSTPGNTGTFYTGDAVNNASGTENGWALKGDGDPNIEKNLTGSDIAQGTPGDPYSLIWRPGTVAFGPANGGAVARFTATVAGLYDISSTYQTIQIRDSSSDGTTGYLYVNGTYVSDTGALVTSGQYGTPETLTDSVTLAPGDTVDFLVTGGNFTTQVDATLTTAAVPEPSNVILGGVLLLGLCVYSVRKSLI